MGLPSWLADGRIAVFMPGVEPDESSVGARAEDATDEDAAGGKMAGGTVEGGDSFAEALAELVSRVILLENGVNNLLRMTKILSTTKGGESDWLHEILVGSPREAVQVGVLPVKVGSPAGGSPRAGARHL